ncbi:MAG: hypothetical protein ACE366_29300 [Bradymonadia bacterium]
MSDDHASRPPSRRAVLGATTAGLVGVAVVRGAASQPLDRLPEATSDVSRVRAGGRVQLRCPGAKRYRVVVAGVAEQCVDATGPEGHATLRVPHFERDQEWTPITCTPETLDGATGEPVVVQVLTAPLVFGC